MTLRGIVCASVLAVGFAASGCNDFHLSTSNLDISPNPAKPGDVVVARFILSLVPPQRHTVIVFIDDVEHMRVTNSAAPEIPVTIELGDAADLIARYGAGEHVAYIVVQANDKNEATRTQSVGFVLEEDAP